MSTVDDADRPRQSRCLTPDGLEIAVYDFGGRGPDLLLVHATGFCAEVFAPLARHWATGFHCFGLDLQGPRPLGPPSRRELRLVRVRHRRAGGDRPLGLLAPSGSATRAAARRSCWPKRPARAPSGRSTASNRSSCPAAGGLAPVETTRCRGGPAAARDLPVSRGRLRQFLLQAARSPSLDPEVLRCYVEAGFEPIPAAEGGDGQSIRLRCRREDEAEVYAHGASPRRFQPLSEIGCPVTLACGERTDAFGPSFLEADAAQLGCPTIEVLAGRRPLRPACSDPRLVAVVGRARALDPGDGTPPS